MSGIVAFVLNDVEHDSRVLREAASLHAAGHEVVIVGRTRNAYAAVPERTTTSDGVPLIRVPVARGPLRWLLLARRPRAFLAEARDMARRDPATFVPGAVVAVLLAVPAAIVAVPAALLAALLSRLPPVATAWRGVSWRLSWTFAVQPWAKAAAAAALTEVPKAAVFWAHDLRALPAAIAARDVLGTARIVYDAHEIFSEAGEHARRPSWARRQMARLERTLAARADALVTVNELLAERLGPALGIGRVVVARNCPPRRPGPAGESPLRTAAGVPTGAPLLLYHGGLAPGRGIATLAACLDQPGLEAAHVVFMGSGPSRGQVAALAAASRRIHLLPPVLPDMLLNWVAGADVVVAPIRPTTLNHRLSSPNKVFEGIAAGVPVVASDLPGIGPVILGDPGGPLGAVANPDDVPAFAAAVRGVLELPPGAAAELRARCRAAAEDHLNWETEAVGLLDLAAELDPAPFPDPTIAASRAPAAAGTPSQRICYVLASTGEFDARTMRLATGSAARGHAVTIVARAGEGLPDDAEPGPRIRLIRVPVGPPSPRQGGLPGPLRLIGEARRILGVMGQVRRQGRALDGLELDADIVQAMGFLALPVAARLARRTTARLVYDARDLYVESNNIARLPGPLRAMFAWREGRLARAADAVLTVNESCADYLEARYRIPRPTVVMNGQLPWTPPVPPPDRLRTALGLGPKRRVVLYHGGFMRDRGLLELVEAMAPTRMADADLVFMGEGPEEQRLRETIASLAARDRMHVLPAVAPAELLEWVASADVGVMVNQPRTLNERLSTPNKLFECLTAGTPVVSSDFPERRRIILENDDGPLGRVCDPGDPAAIAGAIREILDLRPADARALRDRCRRAGRERFGWGAQFERAIAVYGTLTGRPW